MAFKPGKEETFEGDILFLGEYRPTGWHKEQGGGPYPEHSSRIWDVKNKKNKGLSYFSEYLVKKLKKPTAIAVVPSHHSGIGATTGLHMLAGRLAKDLGLSNGSPCLVRHTTVDKKATGGDRSIEGHLASIKVAKADRIKGHVVLLIDDITTTGNSLLACKRLLMEAGAKDVIMLALGKTTH